MDKTQTYQVFATVAEKLSFTKAAEALNLPRATVSTTIQTLETRLRVQLLNRTTRQVSLTLEGEAFLERCLQILGDIDDLEDMFKRSSFQLKGKVRVDMAVNFTREIVLPRLSRFYERYPDIEIDLSSSDSFINPVEEGVDLVIRSGQFTQGQLVVKPLMSVRFGNYASPNYLERYGKPTSPEQLNQHWLVVYSQKLKPSEAYFVYQNGEEVRIPMKSRIQVNNTVSYTEACLAGLGIAQLPTASISQYLRAGLLVEVLPEHRRQDSQLDLIYHQSKQLSRKIKVFIDWLEETVASL